MNVGDKQTSLERFFGKSREDERGVDDGKSATTEAETAKKKKVSLNRTYDKQYLKYGFFVTGDSHTPSPLCVICRVKMSNEAMKPLKLLHHLETKHPALKDKPLEFFEQKKGELQRQKQVLRATTSTNSAALRATHLVANRITKA